MESGHAFPEPPALCGFLIQGVQPPEEPRMQKLSHALDQIHNAHEETRQIVQRLFDVCAEFTVAAANSRRCIADTREMLVTVGTLAWQYRNGPIKPGWFRVGDRATNQEVARSSRAGRTNLLLNAGEGCRFPERAMVGGPAFLRKVACRSPLT